MNREENNEFDEHVQIYMNGKEVSVLIDEKRYVHFDINHNNFIVWKDGKELYNKLKKRIKATIIS